MYQRDGLMQQSVSALRLRLMHRSAPRSGVGVAFFVQCSEAGRPAFNNGLWYAPQMDASSHWSGAFMHTD